MANSPSCLILVVHQTLAGQAFVVPSALQTWPDIPAADERASPFSVLPMLAGAEEKHFAFEGPTSALHTT